MRRTRAVDFGDQVKIDVRPSPLGAGSVVTTYCLARSILVFACLVCQLIQPQQIDPVSALPLPRAAQPWHQ